MIENIGLEFAKVIDPLLAWIRTTGVGPGLAATIVLVGCTLAIYIFVRGLRDYLLIKEAREILGKGGSESEFAKNYNLITQELSAVKKIGGAWQEFSETLIPPTTSEEGIHNPCQNSERPHDFFTLSDLEMGPNFTKSLPNIFIGVGLSLTFLGLISALGSAVDGIADAGGDTIEIQNSISDLLNAASAKFYASLFALFTSIILTLEIKGITSKLGGDLNRLNQSIENGVRFITLESLSIESNKIMRNQLAQLQTFNTDLAMKVGEQVQMSLEKTLSPLVEKMSDMGAEINDSNITNLTKITEEVTRGIQGAAGESMDRVANTLDGVSEKLSGLTDILSGALSSFDSDFKSMLDGLKTSLEDSTHSVAEGVGKTMAGMNEGIEQSASTVTGLVTDLAGTIETLSRSGEDIAARGGEALSASVTAAAEAAGSSISQAGKDLSDGFKESTTDLVASFSKITNQLSELEESLTGMPGNLSRVNDKLAISSDSISDASVQFRAASGGLQGVIEPLTNYATETRELMLELTESLSGASKEITESVGIISETVETLKTDVGQQFQALAGSDEQLAELLIGIESSTEKVLGMISNYVSNIDSGFRASLGVLENTIAALEDTLTESINNSNPGDDN